jgi:TonB family protein
MRLSVRNLAVASIVALFLAAGALEAQQVYERGNGITMPKLTREVKPQYTRAAMEARIQGNVEMSAVILDDGSVGEVKVTKSLDTEHGLDEAAVTAIKQWQFTPGQKDGQPVAVRVDVEMTFRLK